MVHITDKMAKRPAKPLIRSCVFSATGLVQLPGIHISSMVMPINTIANVNSSMEVLDEAVLLTAMFLSALLDALDGNLFIIQLFFANIENIYQLSKHFFYFKDIPLVKPAIIPRCFPAGVIQFHQDSFIYRRI